MSLPDRFTCVRLSGVAALLIVAALSSACTVRPLYSDAGTTTAGIAPSAAGLREIVIDPVNTRYGQELRNNLIFAFNGGSGQPATPKYRMTLAASVLVIDEAVVQIGDENRSSAGTMQMTGSYALIDLATGKTVAGGSRTIPASFDQPSQEFANLRARRDAENRAARELAELLKLDVAQKLAKL